MGEKRDAARKKILDEFHGLIRRRGYAQISLRQLSALCGMSTGHIHFYFKKKEDLMIALCDAYQKEAYKVISEYNALTKNEFVRFLLHHIFLGFLLSRRDTTYKFASEIAENAALISWRADVSYRYAQSALSKAGIHESDERIADACLIATAGVYAIVRKYYPTKKLFDYKKNFLVFSNTFLSQLHCPQAASHVEQALRLFETMDKEALLDRFQRAMGGDGEVPPLPATD